MSDEVAVATKEGFYSWVFMELHLVCFLASDSF